MFSTVANTNQRMHMMRNRPNVNTKKNRKVFQAECKKFL